MRSQHDHNKSLNMPKITLHKFPIGPILYMIISELAQSCSVNEASKSHKEFSDSNNHGENQCAPRINTGNIMDPNFRRCGNYLVNHLCHRGLVFEISQIIWSFQMPEMRSGYFILIITPLDNSSIIPPAVAFILYCHITGFAVDFILLGFRTVL